MAIQKVVVVDGNNLIVRIDRGVAGRSVTDVVPVEIDNALYLEFYFSDGTTETVGPVGTIQYIGASPIVVTGSTISLSTVPVNLGGTGQTTANAGFNALAPSQTGNSGKYLKTDGTNSSWDTLDISTGDITGTLPITNGGTGATTASGARTNLGLGTIATQDSSNVSITGGSITGITDLAVADGGTGASTASGARTNLGLGTISTQDASAVAITGGSITGITDLAIADGGTGASTSSGARTNLGLGTIATQDSSNVSITGGSITGITDLAIADGGTGASTASGARSNLGLGTAATLNAGVANGVATLDSGGTVPLSQIPASIQGGVSYQGSWNALTNTPTLSSGVGSKGYYYVVSVAGNTNLNGVTDWLPGDWAIFNGTAWEKIDNTDAVASVNGYTGVVVLSASDVGAPPTSRTISAGTGLSGGGDLSANRTISLANTAVTAGSYGSASSVGNFTVDGQGRLTAAASTTIAISNTQVSGLGTMSTQDANNVSITGGSISGITDLAVADGGTGASTASGARTNLGAAASGANSDITSMSGITGSISTVDYVAFDTTYTTALTAGQLGWDGNNTLGLGMAGGNVVQKIGEDQFYYIKASSAITKGQVVMFTGSVGASGVVTGAPAASVTDGSYIMGIAAESIAVNGFGLIQFEGTLRGFDTSAFTDGDILWYNPSVTGGLTATKPSAPYIKVQMCAVINAGNAASGSVLVRVSAGSVLGGTDSNVQFGTLANGNLIQYDSTLQYWKNVAPSDVSVTTFSGGTTGLTPSTATAGAVTLAGTLGISNGGTGQTTANAAFNALAPDQTGNSGKYLTTDGSNTSWATNPLGTVTSVSGTGTVSGISLSGTVTTSGSLTLGGSLDLSAPPAIGGTTPAAGAFTTLSASSDLTLSGGTANGVLYLNGSKVATSGSALTFDGTTLKSQYLNVQDFAASNDFVIGFRTNAGSQVGYIGVVSSANNLSVTSSNSIIFNPSSSEQMRLTSTGLGIGTSSPAGRLQASVGSSPNAANILIGYSGLSANYFDANQNIFRDGSFSELMRLTSTGLGIGTSSPGYKLDVNGTAAFAGATVFNGGANTIKNTGELQWKDSGGTAQNVLFMYSDNNVYLSSPATSSSLIFRGVGYAERMRLDSSGNLGLGVTPSAWNSDYRTMQFGATGLLYGRSGGEVAFGTNWYRDSGGAFRYLTSAAATYQAQAAGVHYWFTAPSGTAGDPITFTQAMTLTAEGNLGLGQTNPTNISNYKTLTISAPTGSLVDLQSNSVTGLRLQCDTTYPGGAIYALTNNPLVFGTNSTERARIDSSGNFGIGTSSPLTKLDVRGGYITAGTASSVTGTKVLGGYYSNGNIATWGTEYSNGSPVMGYGVWPSTSASGAFVSSTGITVARGAYSIVGNQHFWYSGGAQTVAVDGAVSTSVIAKFDDFGRFLVGTTSNFDGAGQFAIDQSGGGVPAIHLIGTQGVGGGGREIGATFSVVTNDTGTAYGNVAKISAAKENATQGNTAGYMAFSTTPNGGSLTERARIDSSGRFMIGTTSTAAKFVAIGASGNTYIAIDNAASGENYFAANAANIFQTAGSERARITSGGQALFGTTSENLSRWGRANFYYPSGTSNPTIALQNSTARAAGNLYGIIFADNTDESNAAVYVRQTGTNNGADLLFGTNAGTGGATFSAISERARITSDGNFLVGTTSNKGVGITAESVSNTIWTTCTVSGQSALVVQNTNGGAVNLVAFQTGSGFGTGVGSIYYSAGLTVYATTSDYRLKNVIGEVTGAGARIDALEPVEYEWKASGERTRGFLAHKFQEVYPQSVSGTKDAVDENGNPKYQQMQASTTEVIADLVAEIQSLRKRLADAGIA